MARKAPSQDQAKSVTASKCSAPNTARGVGLCSKVANLFLAVDDKCELHFQRPHVIETILLQHAVTNLSCT